MGARRAPAAVAAVLVAALAGVPVSAASSRCEKPRATFVYDAEEVAFTVSADLTGCSWLSQKDRFELSGRLVREGGTGTRAQDGTEVCTRHRVCRLILGMDHLPVEVARYRGAIAFRWRGSSVALRVDKLCASGAATAHCADL